MAAYTSGGDKLHMCYTFDFLAPVFTRSAFPRADRGLRGGRRRRLAVLGLLQPRHHAPRQPLGGGEPRSTRTAWRASRSAFSSRCAARSASTRARSSASPKPSSASRISPIPTASASGRNTRDATAAARRWCGNRTRRTAASPPPSPGCRSPPEHIAHAVNREAGDPDSMLAHYRRMIAFRRAHPALRSGSIAFARRARRRARLRARVRRRGGCLRVQFQPTSRRASFRRRPCRSAP